MNKKELAGYIEFVSDAARIAHDKGVEWGTSYVTHAAFGMGNFVDWAEKNPDHARAAKAHFDEYRASEADQTESTGPIASEAQLEKLEGDLITLSGIIESDNPVARILRGGKR